MIKSSSRFKAIIQQEFQNVRAGFHNLIITTCYCNMIPQTDAQQITNIIPSSKWRPHIPTDSTTKTTLNVNLK